MVLALWCCGGDVWALFDGVLAVVGWDAEAEAVSADDVGGSDEVGQAVRRGAERGVLE